MPSDFKLQVLHIPTGQTVAWAPGQQVERDLIAALKSQLEAKGVGLFRTTKHVLTDLEAAVTDLFLELKKDVPPSR
jgi:hypothetical protein